MIMISIISNMKCSNYTFQDLSTFLVQSIFETKSNGTYHNIKSKCFFIIILVYLELSKNGKLIECASGGLYIRDIHQCNGIAECPDESDENGCEDGMLHQFLHSLCYTK